MSKQMFALKCAGAKPINQI